MANDYSANPIIIDTFNAIIDLAKNMGWAKDTPICLESIEWQTPTTVGDTALITDKVSGSVIFSETCVVANQSTIKYFHGTWVKNLYIAISGVTHGSIIVTLR